MQDIKPHFFALLEKYLQMPSAVMHKDNASTVITCNFLKGLMNELSYCEL